MLLLLFVTVGQAEEMPGGGPPRQKRSFVEGESDPAERKVRARQSPVSRRATPLTSRLCRPSQAKKLALAAEREQLPIWACRDSLLAEVRANQVLILVGETGSGKSTQLPQFLIQARRAGDTRAGQPKVETAGLTLCDTRLFRVVLALQSGLVAEGTAVAVTQPRRVAAVSLARRVAEESGTQLVR